MFLKNTNKDPILLRDTEEGSTGVLLNGVTDQVTGGVAPQDGCIQSVPEVKPFCPAAAAAAAHCFNMVQLQQQQREQRPMKILLTEPQTIGGLYPGKQLWERGQRSRGEESLLSISPKAPPQLTGFLIKLQKGENIDLTPRLSHLISFLFSHCNRSKHSINTGFCYGHFSQQSLRV